MSKTTNDRVLTTKAALVCLAGALALLALVLVATGGSSSSASERATTPARLVVVRGASSCTADQATGTLVYNLDVWNKGGKATTVHVLPWRMYYGGSINDGIWDEQTSIKPLAAHRDRFYTISVHYEGDHHVPIRCRAYVGTSGTDAL